MIIWARVCLFEFIGLYIVYACALSPFDNYYPCLFVCVFMFQCACACGWIPVFVWVYSCLCLIVLVLETPCACACACASARGPLDNYRQAADCRLDGELDPNQNHHYLRNGHLSALEKSTEDFSSFCSLWHFLVNKLRFISDLSQLCSQIESQSSIQNENQNIYCLLRLPSLHF